MTITAILLLVSLALGLADAFKHAEFWGFRSASLAILVTAALFVLIAGLALVGMVPS